MKTAEKERKETYDRLVHQLMKLGCSEEFSKAIASQLGTEKAMGRMLGYLHQGKPQSLEEIADEMLAICDDRDAWVRKKKAEYYNSRYNDVLLHGLEKSERK